MKFWDRVIAKFSTKPVATPTEQECIDPANIAFIRDFRTAETKKRVDEERPYAAELAYGIYKRSGLKDTCALADLVAERGLKPWEEREPKPCPMFTYSSKTQTVAAIKYALDNIGTNTISRVGTTSFQADDELAAKIIASLRK